MGKVKLDIKKLENSSSRQTTYSKRKHGILKKAQELSILCDIDLALVMFSPGGKPSLCCGKHRYVQFMSYFPGGKLSLLEYSFMLWIITWWSLAIISYQCTGFFLALSCILLV